MSQSSNTTFATLLIRVGILGLIFNSLIAMTHSTELTELLPTTFAFVGMLLTAYLIKMISCLINFFMIKRL